MVADRVDRVERAERVLEHYLNLMGVVAVPSTAVPRHLSAIKAI